MGGARVCMGGAGAHAEGNASQWPGTAPLGRWGARPLRLRGARPVRKWRGPALSLGGSVGGAGAAGAPQTALPPAVNSIITGHGVGAPLK